MYHQQDEERTDAENEPGIDDNFRTRKKLRRDKKLGRAKAKDLRNSGKATTGKGGRQQEGKSVQPYPYNCRIKVMKISQKRTVK